MPTPRVFPAIWRFLISLRLTLFLLFILSAACIIGTVVPQKAALEEYVRLYGEAGSRLIAACHFFDLFGSWWFQLTMAFFALNLICCTLNRAPRLWRLLRAQPAKLEPARLAALSSCRTAVLEHFDAGCEQRFSEELTTALKRPLIWRDNDAVTLFAEKGRWSRLAFLLTHIGLLLILGGAMLGNLGFNGFMQLYEGDQSDIVHLRNGQGQHQLDFTVRCNSFEVHFWENTWRPKAYLSSLTVIEQGREVLTKTISVNDPLIYRGIYFYQSSYGSDPTGRGILELEVGVPDVLEPFRVNVEVGSSFVIPGTQDEIFVDRFLQDFALDDQTRQPFSRSRELNNPAVLLRAQREGEHVFTSWLFARFPDFHSLQTDPYRFRMLNFEPRQFTGLQVAKDPGVEVVWAGCAFLMLGMYMAFFCSHRRIWIHVRSTPQGHETIVAGETSKHRAAFKKQFSALCERLLS